MSCPVPKRVCVMCVLLWAARGTHVISLYGPVVPPRVLTCTGLQDGTLRLWEFRRGRELQCCPLTGPREPAEPAEPQVAAGLGGDPVVGTPGHLRGVGCWVAPAPCTHLSPLPPLQRAAASRLVYWRRERCVALLCEG